MSLTNEFRDSGNWLFRRRGFLPVILLMAGMVFLIFYLQAYPVRPPLWYELLCMAVAVCGLGIRAYTIGHTPKNTSGRNIKKQLASVLNTSGIYSVVRHPLYLGNFFIWLGLAMFVFHFWFALLAVAVFWIYYERIMFAEEAFLHEKFGRDFERWSSRTPAFIPRFSKFTPPGLSFSWKNILKREYNGFGNMVFGFGLTELVRSSALAGRLFLPLHWIIIMGSGLIIWLVIRTIEKNTGLFEAEGR